MRWRGERESGEIEDRRGLGIPGGGFTLSGGGILLILALSLITGRNPLDFIQILQQPSSSIDEPQQGKIGAPSDEGGRFVSVVLASTEDVWTRKLAARGIEYRKPTLVLFDDAVQSACGTASSAVGQFYCPLDQHVYLDLGFFTELQQRFGAPGEFARAYVVAHEVGHHVQTLLGITEKVEDARRGLSPEEGNALSVRVELQADCFAGVWGHEATNLLEPGDVESGLAAAKAIGDDTLQRRAQGHVVPETWTHGSSEMRVRWLRRGLDSGDVGQCDTFAAR